MGTAMSFDVTSAQPLAFAPASPTPVPEIAQALRSVTALEGLSDEEYLWIATHATERRGESGALLFRENEPACCMNFILEGEVHVRRRNSGPMNFFIGRAGQMTGKLPFSRMKHYGGEGYSIGPIWSLDLPETLFPALLQAIPSMAQRCVSILLDRVREVTRMEQQAEKLSALGKLAANLAHELNNPASAAQRSAASLFSELRGYGEKKMALGEFYHSGQFSERLKQWIACRQDEMPEYLASDSRQGSPLAEVDREATVLSWLEKHNVPDAWTMAPSIAETRFPLSYLDEFATLFPAEMIAPAMAAFSSSIRVQRMAETVLGSTVRIFDLISAIKDYSYMDQAPLQDVDLAQSLETTLSMFGSRLAKISLQTDFDEDLPPIHAFGSELNQVWTVLIENALDAMPEGGTLRLNTRLQGQMAMVEIINTGVEIPQELQTRIFEPFFTTKAPGQGLGLGLDTSQRIVSKHSGFLRVTSSPEETCFQVRLPLDQAQAY